MGCQRIRLYCLHDPFCINIPFIIRDICVRPAAADNCSCAVFSFSTATKADSFALYFLGECNNVST